MGFGRSKGKQVSCTGGNDIRSKYTLLATELGRGAYASVILGKNNENDQRVAIKKITKQGLRHRDMRKLHEEANILKTLRHRNIVKVYDSYEDDQYFYIVMEYVGGGELFKQIVDDERQFTENEARELLRTLLLALQYCKNNGVVHRDIKPENILLTRDDEVKVVDFNLAKQVDKDVVGYSVLETMCGTPNYVAPEVINGTPYDYKCDIWSVGVISYLVLSGGYLPFFVNKKQEGSNARDALLKKVLAGRWKFSPERAWVGVSSNAKDFVSKMLVRDPEARFGYEQLLAHPWMKFTQEAIGHRIGTSRPLPLKTMRKFLEVTAVNDAVKQFEMLMTEGSTPVPAAEEGFDIMPSSENIFDSLGVGDI